MKSSTPTPGFLKNDEHVQPKFHPSQRFSTSFRSHAIDGLHHGFRPTHLQPVAWSCCQQTGRGFFRTWLWNFLQQAQNQFFDFIFADTWSGKYRLLDEALSMVKPGGFYVIDDMLPQANWPAGHAQKVESLLKKMNSLTEWHTTTLNWASGVVIAVRR